MNITQIAQLLQYGALQGFGLSMPLLAPDWSPSGASNPSFTATDTAGLGTLLTMTASANWAAPLDAIYANILDGNNLPVTLAKVDGTAEAAPGVLLTIPDQSWRRLGWLYCEILEEKDSTRPERERGLSCRPVPRYIYFPNNHISAGSPTSVNGLAEAGADLGFAGDARFYDSDGLQIDPIAVMAAFEAILTHYPPLQAMDLGSTPVSPLPLTNYLTGDTNPLASSKVTRIRLVTPAGGPYNPDTLHLTGLTEVDKASGLYEISGSPETISLDSADTTTGSTFSQYDHDRLVFGPATSGRLSDTFTAPALPTLSPSISLARDYYTIRVVELQSYLLGTWPDSTDDPATKVQRYPLVHINENISFLPDGNDVLGAVHAALESGSPSASHVSSPHSSPPESDLTLVVAQAIDGNFPIPSAAGTSAHWPHFPPGITVDPNATLSINLGSQLALAASWTTASETSPTSGDVILEISGLPPMAWARVYTRQFAPDATVTRGNGQGRGIPADGTIVLELSDPLLLRSPLSTTTYLPSPATLQFDLSVTLPNGNTRIYGGLTVNIGNTIITSPPLTPDTAANPCGTAKYQSVSDAGILGLGKAGWPSPHPSTAAEWAEALTGEGTPRNAPRLPTMARRELLAAGAGSDANSGSPYEARTWTAVIGGGRIQGETVSASSRIGAPGSLGGRETSYAAVTTHGGPLAYDIARHALRRSQDIIPRLATLFSSDWDTPSDASAIGIGKQPSATNGTMAGAVLQTIAPWCESPELGGLWINDTVSSAITDWITGNVSNGSLVSTAYQELGTTPVPSAPATEAPPGSQTTGQYESYARRLAIELERELTSVKYGRRDAQWALQASIQNARNIIYIETPGFCSTAVPSGSPAASLSKYAMDMVALLKQQMQKMPGLRVIVCVSKTPDFATGYESMAAYEVQDRSHVANLLGGGSPSSSSQFILFHPIGFPGRSARVETNVVIVDDIWAMAGGLSMRRRGLTFDGSSDLAFTDTLLENGYSAAIRDFRRGLMANRLGIPAASTEATYVALSEAPTAFAAIHDALAGGGLGDIAPLWNGDTPGIDPVTPLSAALANPDGRDFDEVVAGELAGLFASSFGV